MSNRKKKTYRDASKTSDAKPSDPKTLAEQLKALKLEVESTPEVQSKASGSAAKSTPKAKPDKPRPAPDIPPEAPQAELSERELFEAALNELSGTDVYRGKYEGLVEGIPAATDAHSEALKSTKVSGSETERPAGTSSETAPRVKDEQAGRHAVESQREFRVFQRAVGKVEPLANRDKYYQPTPPPPDSISAPQPYSSEVPEDTLITPSLPKAGQGLHEVPVFNEAQKAMQRRFKQRSRRHSIPELNLRGESSEDALRQLELFVHQSWRDRTRFVRIIHGRGLSSADAPVLKPAVLHWLEGPGLRYIIGYIPETTSSGDYGSLVVELARAQ